MRMGDDGSYGSCTAECFRAQVQGLPLLLVGLWGSYLTLCASRAVGRRHPVAMYPLHGNENLLCSLVSHPLHLEAREWQRPGLGYDIFFC